jgi:putative methyltransferase (TIGR04325 family)
MKELIKSIPFLLQGYLWLQKLRYERRFAGDCYGCFLGVFETFEEAILSAPRTKEIGYDNPELAQEYKRKAELSNTIQSVDYPALFWLISIFGTDDVKAVFDFGGNVGQHFYICEKHRSVPAQLKWIVCDVPETVKAGRELAERRYCTVLEFTTSIEGASGKDIFFASGSIQYVKSFSLDLLCETPRHCIINRLPLYEGPQFVTLQNGGKVFYPQYVFNRAGFIHSFEELGYKLIEMWEDRYDSCIIPGYPDQSLASYHGLYFKLVR